VQVKTIYKTIAFVFDGALLATFFDFTIEPVAIKLNFWQWQNHEIPVFNYACWFIISAVLLRLFKWLHFNKDNHFAVHLFIIQYLFFIALQLYL
jgi:putative membrane protein